MHFFIYFKHVITFLFHLWLLKSALVPNELIVDLHRVSNLLVESHFCFFQSLLPSLPLLLELGLVVTTIYSLHLSVLVDRQKDGGVCVHEADLAQINLELPKLDQVLWSWELEKQKTVLFWIQAFVGRTHQDKKLVFNCHVRFDTGHRVELETPLILGIDAFHVPDFHLACLSEGGQVPRRALEDNLRSRRV